VNTLPGEHERDRDENGDRLPYDPELGFLFILEREVTRKAIAAREARAHGAGPAALPASAAGEGSERLRRSAPAPSTRLARQTNELGRRAGAAIRPPTRRSRPNGSRRGSLRPLGRRVARRSLTLVALLCLIGASAFGAGRLLTADGPNPADPRQSAFVQVAEGRSGPDSFSLRLYLRGGELCRALLVADTESSRCSPRPASDRLGVTSVVSPTRRYVYGVTGARIARVEVRAGEQTSTVYTRPTAAAGETARVLPPGSRWFLAVLRRPTGEPDPRALVQGLGTDGRALTPAVSDCAEAPESLGCGVG
jgi:hypothetical protein